MAGKAARPFLDLGRRLEEYLTGLPPMSDSDLVDSLGVWLEEQGRVVLAGAEAAVEQAARQGWERGAARALADSKFTKKGGNVLTLNATGAELGVISAVRSRTSVRENLKGVLGWGKRLVRRVWDETRNGVQQVVGDLLGKRLGLGTIIPAVKEKVRKQGRKAGDAAKNAVIKGHAEGQLDVYETVGVKILVRMVEFTTARDMKVCPTCRMYARTRLTPDKARGVIPLHPNCRCIWVPIEVEETVYERRLVSQPSSPSPAQPVPTIPATTNLQLSPDPVPDPAVLFSRFLKERI